MTESEGSAFRRTCAWCSEPTPAGATTCPACGAAVAQRSTIGELVIPGVTAVDPALKALDGQPLRIPGPSPTQGLAGGVVLAAAAGGPLAVAALGGLAAVAAVEYLGANRGGPSAPVELDKVGKPSEAVLRALGRLDAEGDSAPEQPGSGAGSPADGPQQAGSAVERGSAGSGSTA